MMNTFSSGVSPSLRRGPAPSRLGYRLGASHQPRQAVAALQSPHANATARHIGLLFLFLFLVVAAFGQRSATISRIAGMSPFVVPYYEAPDTINRSVYIKMGFNNDDIASNKQVQEARRGQIIGVELVYSSWRASATFDQVALNKKRLGTLADAIKGILDDPLIKWRLIEQTAATNADEAKELFHGFVLWFRPEVSPESMKSELAMIKSHTSDPDCIKEAASKKGKKKVREASKPLIRYLGTKVKYPDYARRMRLDGRANLAVWFNESGGFDSLKVISIPDSSFIKSITECFADMHKYKVKHPPGCFQVGLIFDTPGPNKFKVLVDADIRRIKYNETNIVYLEKTESDASVLCPPLPDSTIFRIFGRNTNWEKVLVIEDLTGSMSPYTLQLLVWNAIAMQNKQSKFSKFVFFNDGDMKPDHMKLLGFTDGIYISSDNPKPQELDSLVALTMSRGFGGDVPENNIEATIKGIQACPDCKEVVMIADNFATPRDLSLLSEVKRPIRVVLCGTNYGRINTHYLDIARQTGGSFHTMEQDLQNLSTLTEGEIITIGEESFRIEQGVFRKVIKM